MHKFKKHKLITMLMALVLLFGMSVPATLAYMSVKSETVKNTFVPVKSPVHDLEISVSGEKELTGRDWTEGDVYSFQIQIWDVNQWKTIGTDAVAYDKDNEDFNKFDVSDIIKEQIKEPREYSFRIAEIKGVDPTITYDETACRFDVVVEADETGAMDITSVENMEGTDVVKDETTGNYSVGMSFTNKYTAPIIPPEPEDPDPVKIDFVVDKTVINLGKTEIGPKGFDFKLVKNSTKEEWTAEADENGYAAFNMTYTKDDIGKTYLYELSEVNDGVEDVIYSDEVYDISVGIDLSEDNELIATIKMDDKVVKNVEAKFENIYMGELDDETEPDDENDPTDPSDPSKPTKPGDGDLDDDDGTKPADKDDGSKTGDDSNMLPFMIIMIACLAVMTIVVVSGRRRKN